MGQLQTKTRALIANDELRTVLVKKSLSEIVSGQKGINKAQVIGTNENINRDIVIRKLPKRQTNEEIDFVRDMMNIQKRKEEEEEERLSENKNKNNNNNNELAKSDLLVNNMEEIMRRNTIRTANVNTVGKRREQIDCREFGQLKPAEIYELVRTFGNKKGERDVNDRNSDKDLMTIEQVREKYGIRDRKDVESSVEHLGAPRLEKVVTPDGQPRTVGRWQ
jgi:hypothetical protein